MGQAPPPGRPRTSRRSGRRRRHGRPATAPEPALALGVDAHRAPSVTGRSGRWASTGRVPGVVEVRSEPQQAAGQGVALLVASSRRWPSASSRRRDSDTASRTERPEFGQAQQGGPAVGRVGRPGDEAGGDQVADLAADASRGRAPPPGDVRQPDRAPPRTPGPAASSRSGSPRCPSGRASRGTSSRRMARATWVNDRSRPADTRAGRRAGRSGWCPWSGRSSVLLGETGGRGVAGLI